MLIVSTDVTTLGLHMFFPVAPATPVVCSEKQGYGDGLQVDGEVHVDVSVCLWVCVFVCMGVCV